MFPGKKKITVTISASHSSCLQEIDKEGERGGAGYGRLIRTDLHRRLIDGRRHPVPLASFPHTLAVANLISTLIECNLVKRGALLIFPVSFQSTDGQRNFH